MVKNKVAPPFKTAEFDIMYGEGISKVGEILDIAVEHEIIKKSGSWFSYEDTKLGQGRDAVKSLIKDNPELMDELELKIKELNEKIEERVIKFYKKINVAHLDEIKALSSRISTRER